MDVYTVQRFLEEWFPLQQRLEEMRPSYASLTEDRATLQEWDAFQARYPTLFPHLQAITQERADFQRARLQEIPLDQEHFSLPLYLSTISVPPDAQRAHEVLTCSGVGWEQRFSSLLDNLPSDTHYLSALHAGIKRSKESGYLSYRIAASPTLKEAVDHSLSVIEQKVQ